MLIVRLAHRCGRLKHKIHNTRLPIKNKKLLFLVQCGYFCAPIVIGCYVMKLVEPDPEDMRARIRKPSPEAQAQIDAQRHKLQAEFDAARAARQREQQTQ